MSARHRRLASLGPAQSMSILQNCYAACSWMTVPLMDHQMILWQQHQPVGAATDRAFLRKRRLDDDCCDGVYNKNNTHARTGHMQAHIGSVRLLVGPDRAHANTHGILPSACWTGPGTCKDMSASFKFCSKFSIHVGPRAATLHPIFSSHTL